MPFKYPSAIERILANSVIDETSWFDGSFCWTWLGSFKRSRSGKVYPRIGIRVRGRNVTLTVHRFIIKYIKRRRLSKRQVGMHLCDNTACVNPAHIIGGTQRKNIRHQVEVGHHKHNNNISKFNEERKRNAARTQTQSADAIPA